MPDVATILWFAVLLTAVGALLFFALRGRPIEKVIATAERDWGIPLPRDLAERRRQQHRRKVLIAASIGLVVFVLGSWALFAVERPVPPYLVVYAGLAGVFSYGVFQPRSVPRPGDSVRPARRLKDYIGTVALVATVVTLIASVAHIAIVSTAVASGAAEFQVEDLLEELNVVSFVAGAAIAVTLLVAVALRVPSRREIVGERIELAWIDADELMVVSAIPLTAMIFFMQQVVGANSLEWADEFAHPLHLSQLAVFLIGSMAAFAAMVPQLRRQISMPVKKQMAEWWPDLTLRERMLFDKP